MSRLRVFQAGLFLLTITAAGALALGAWRVGAALVALDVGAGTVVLLDTQARFRSNNRFLYARHEARAAKRHAGFRKLNKRVASLDTKLVAISKTLSGVATSTAVTRVERKMPALDASLGQLGSLVVAASATTREIRDHLEDATEPRASTRASRSHRLRDLVFTDVDVAGNGRSLSATYRLLIPSSWGPTEETGVVNFTFDRPVHVDENAAAFALAAVVSPTMKSVRIDIDVTEAVEQAIQAWALRTEFSFSSIRAGGRLPVADPTHDRPLLAFSGGVDSLAALQLLPDHTALYGIDLGGRFSREREFFSSWKPATMTTNLIDTSLREVNWAFMAIPALMGMNHFRADTLTFGSLDEKGGILFDPEATGQSTRESLFAAAGMQLAPCLVGLTEVGVTKVVLEAVPDLVAGSILSSGSPGDDKPYWKRMLAIVASSRFGLPFEAPDCAPRAQPRHAYGEYFPVDLLSFWLAKHGGREAVDYVVRDAPEDLFTTAEHLRLTFFERANPNMYLDHYPSHLRSVLLAKFSEYGIAFYDDHDRAELTEVGKVLSRYHPLKR